MIMRLFKTDHNDQLIYPGDRDLVYFWIKKWGVTDAQLNDAIIETGSIKAGEIRKYLMTKGLIFSFSGILEKVKGKR
jgi:uncharacterized protein DUF3606